MQVRQRKTKPVSSGSPSLTGLFHVPAFAWTACISSPRFLSPFTNRSLENRFTVGT